MPRRDRDEPENAPRQQTEASRNERSDHWPKYGRVSIPVGIGTKRGAFRIQGTRAAMPFLDHNMLRRAAKKIE